MAILSKELYAKYMCKDTPCSIIHMWSSSCIDGVSAFGLNAFIGCLKFFGPIYVIKLLLNWQKINPKYLTKQSIALLRSILYGVAYGILFIGGLCTLANTVGIHYYNIFRVGLLCGVAILIDVPENRILNTMMLFNQALEGIFNLATNRKSKKKPQWTETAVFMCISSILMYLFKTQDLPQKFEHLWFYPGGNLFDKSKDYRNVSQESYTAKKVFLEDAPKEALKYFCIGYVLEIMKKVLSRFGVLASKPKYLFPILFNKKNILFGLFFGGYTFLYRCISYCLFKQNGTESRNHALIAGFMAGSAYYFRPNIQITIIGVTTILQLFWERLRKKLNFPKDFPYYMIICCLSTGFIMHLRFHWEDYCPTYSKNMLKVATNNLETKAYNAIWYLIRECEKHELNQIQ